jgi:hypothetical protein
MFQHGIEDGERFERSGPGLVWTHATQPPIGFSPGRS